MGIYFGNPPAKKKIAIRLLIGEALWYNCLKLYCGLTQAA